MAYRQPTDRRDRTSDMTTTSYLEHCLDQVNNLPNKTQESLEQIRLLDDKINTLMNDGETQVQSTISRATTKNMPAENAKRSYQELMHIQKSAAEAASKKVSVALSVNDLVNDIYADVEKKLSEFEALLKKDGRWPSMNSNPNNTSTNNNTNTNTNTNTNININTNTNANTNNNTNNNNNNNNNNNDSNNDNDNDNDNTNDVDNNIKSTSSQPPPPPPSPPQKPQLTEASLNAHIFSSKFNSLNNTNSVPTTRSSQKSRLRSDAPKHNSNNNNNVSNVLAVSDDESLTNNSTSGRHSNSNSNNNPGGRTSQRRSSRSAAVAATASMDMINKDMDEDTENGTDSMNIDERSNDNTNTNSSTDPKIELSNMDLGTDSIKEENLNQVDKNQQNDKELVNDSSVMDDDQTNTAKNDSEVTDNTLYCKCRTVSLGPMIACEDDDCPYEWFHFKCVGVETEPPEGTEWYCDDCKVRRLREGTLKQEDLDRQLGYQKQPPQVET